MSLSRMRGMAMVEALVASSLLALGLLGATRLTTHALQAALQTRQEVQALVLTVEALDCAAAHLMPCPATAEHPPSGGNYRLELTRTPVDASLSEVQAHVQWSDTSGRDQSLRLPTRVSAMPDGLALSLP